MAFEADWMNCLWQCFFQNIAFHADGELEFDDRGFRCYWDAELEGWIVCEAQVSKRFQKVLDAREDFQGFDEYENDDTDPDTDECMEDEDEAGELDEYDEEEEDAYEEEEEDE